MGRVVVWSDYVCPFCYLAWSAVRALLEEGHDIELRAFELRPAPAPLPRRLGPEEREAWDVVVAPRAAAAGLPLREPTIVPRTRKAHEAALHGRAAGRAAEWHDALFRGYFGEGLDIGRIDVLVSIGAELGHEPSSVKVELDIDQYAAAVVAEEREARALGVEAVPAYVVQGERTRVHLGLMSTDELRAWLARDNG